MPELFSNLIQYFRTMQIAPKNIIEIAVLAFLIYGFTLPGYLCAMLYDGIFRDLEKE